MTLRHWLWMALVALVIAAAAWGTQSALSPWSVGAGAGNPAPGWEEASGTDGSLAGPDRLPSTEVSLLYASGETAASPTKGPHLRITAEQPSTKMLDGPAMYVYVVRSDARILVDGRPSSLAGLRALMAARPGLVAAIVARGGFVERLSVQTVP